MDNWKVLFRRLKPPLQKFLGRQITRGELEAVSQQQKVKYSTAFFISRLFGPVPLLCLLWLATALKSGIGAWKALWVYPLIFVIGIAAPFLVTTFLVVIGKVESFEWSRLKDRYLMFAVVLFFWLIDLIFIYFLTNRTIFHLALLAGEVTAAALLVMAVFQFKISLHTTAASGVFWGVNFLTHFRYWWLFFFLIPIVWARYVLKIHTAKELAAGFVLANGLIIIAVAIFGLPAVP